jgi:hypothetical protein
MTDPAVEEHEHAITSSLSYDRPAVELCNTSSTHRPDLISHVMGVADQHTANSGVKEAHGDTSTGTLAENYEAPAVCMYYAV